jgi:hypothetical protein
VRGAQFCSRDAPDFGQLVQRLLAVLGTSENPAGNMAADVVILTFSGEDRASRFQRGIHPSECSPVEAFRDQVTRRLLR